MAEKEYIERGALMEKLDRKKPTITTQRYVEGFNDAIMRFRSMVHSAPAADVVEVVRCKNCKNAYINSFSAQSGIAVCRFLANRSNGELTIVQQDDFCSYGERKEQE